MWGNWMSPCLFAESQKLSAKIFFHDTFHLICSFRHKLNHYYTVLNLSLQDHIMLLITSSPNFQNSGFGEWVTWTNTIIILPSCSSSVQLCILRVTMAVAVVSPDDVSIEICRHDIDLLLWSTHAHNSHFVGYDVNPHTHGDWTGLCSDISVVRGSFYASWGTNRWVRPAVFFCGFSEQQIPALTPATSFSRCEAGYIWNPWKIETN